MTQQQLAEIKATDGQLSQADIASMYGSLMENVDQKAEVQISRLNIVQPLTPEVAQGVKGYAAGQIIDGKGRTIRSYHLPQPWLEGKVDVSEREKVWCMPFLTVGKLPTEFTKWNSEEARKVDPKLPRIDWKTLDKDDPRVKEGTYRNRGGTWGTPARPETIGQKPPVTDAINFLVMPLTPEYSMECSFRIATFSRTSAACGRALTTAMSERAVLQQVPWFYVQWLYTKRKTNTAGQTYYVLESALGKPVMECNPSLMPMALDIFNTFFRKPGYKELQHSLLQVTEDEVQEDEHDEDVTTAAAPAADAAAPASPTGDGGFNF